MERGTERDGSTEIDSGRESRNESRNKSHIRPHCNHFDKGEEISYLLMMQTINFSWTRIKIQMDINPHIL